MKITSNRALLNLFWSNRFPRSHVATWLISVCLLLTATMAEAAQGWRSAANLATTRNEASLTLLSDGKVLAAGGYGLDGYISSTELYDPVANAWASGGAMATPRHEHSATRLANGKVLVAGGVGNTATPGASLASAELYDPASNSWTSAGAMSTPRNYHTATLLPNGKVLVAGGWGWGPDSALQTGYLASAELYDPATNTWTSAGSLVTPRFEHTATLLPNGKVLVAGGLAGSGAVANAELYDPATNTWSSSAGMAASVPRYKHSATLLSDGKVLVAGGHNSGPVASAELYDPASNTWTLSGAMNTARAAHSATMLQNGLVLAAGGWNSGYLYDAELFDPKSGAWSTAGAMSTGRVYHKAVLLASGDVLVEGSGAVGNADLYSGGATGAGQGMYTGIWWNPIESGWGLSVEQQGPIMFIGWYTYDQSGASTRYFMSDCAVSGSGCSGSIYRIDGGAAPTAPWSGRGPVTAVGTGTLTFSDANNGVFNFVLNGVAGSKIIARNVFGSPVAAPAIDYTALWWNPNESGWGVFISHQSQNMFAALFTYDAQGKPMRYVASNCSVSADGNGCSGTLYKTAGGSEPTVPWMGPIALTPVGNIAFTFATAGSGSMNFTIDGQSGSKTISKMIFYTAPN